MGEIVHPTIEDFVLMILQFVESRPGLTMAAIWMVFYACSFPGDNESDNFRARINPTRDGANVC